MKKIMCVFLLVIAMLFVFPLSSYAGHPGVHGGASIRVGHVAWRGHYGGWHGGWHRPYGWGLGFYWGGPIWGSPWYPWYPYGYYAAPPAVIQEQPPVYVQPQQPQENYWYYCQDPQGYYPYVKTCPGGWMKVIPQPAPPKP
jgi:hypothetical protein